MLPINMHKANIIIASFSLLTEIEKQGHVLHQKRNPIIESHLFSWYDTKAGEKMDEYYNMLYSMERSGFVAEVSKVQEKMHKLYSETLQRAHKELRLWYRDITIPYAFDVPPPKPELRK